MNKTAFITILEDLDESTWQAIIDGQALAIVDDISLKLCPASSANIIISPTPELDIASLQSKALDQATVLLENYYRKHPLSRKGFIRQATALVAQYGGKTFASQKNFLPERTLFVDGGELIAESQDSPRHQYGAFCELESTFESSVIVDRVEQWIESGEAYERYLEMNICRYYC